MIKKNLRIQLYKDGEMLSERMVAQGPEFYNGPKEKHDGPMRIEFTIDEKKDAEDIITYLQKLILDLPIKTVPGVRGRKSVSQDNDDTFTEDKKEIVVDLIKQHKDLDQDKFIKELRDIGFVFVESPYLLTIVPKGYEFKQRHLENYQWLIRRTKQAKDPKNDKYDPQAIIGIKIMDKRDEKILLYFYGQFDSTSKLDIPGKKAMNASKTNLIKYPHYMTEEERFKWGTEHRLLFNNKEKKPSKFYMRWMKDIEVGEELSISLKNLNKRLNPE